MVDYQSFEFKYLFTFFQLKPDLSTDYVADERFAVKVFL